MRAFKTFNNGIRILTKWANADGLLILQGYLEAKLPPYLFRQIHTITCPAGAGAVVVIYMEEPDLIVREIGRQALPSFWFEDVVVEREKREFVVRQQHYHRLARIGGKQTAAVGVERKLKMSSAPLMFLP